MLIFDINIYNPNKMICDNFRQSKYNKDMLEEINEFEKNAVENNVENTSPTTELALLSDDQESNEYAASSFTQLKWLTWRNFLNIIRNPNEIKVNLFTAIFMSVVYGLTYFESTLDQPGVLSLNGAIFFIIADQSFANANAVITNIPNEMPLFLKEYNSKMYRVFNYYLSKVITEVC